MSKPCGHALLCSRLLEERRPSGGAQEARAEEGAQGSAVGQAMMPRHHVVACGIAFLCWIPAALAPLGRLDAIGDKCTLWLQVLRIMIVPPLIILRLS